MQAQAESTRVAQETNVALMRALSERAAPAAAAPQISINVKAQMDIPKLSVFERVPFLVWTREIEAYKARCVSDGVTPTNLRYAIGIDLVAQTLKALGLPRGDSRSSAWTGLNQETIIPGLENFFFAGVTGGQLLVMFRAMKVPHCDANFVHIRSAFDAFVQEVVSLDSAVERVGKSALLDRKVQCEALSATLKGHSVLGAIISSFKFDNSGALFDHVATDLDAIVTFVQRFSHIPNLFSQSGSQRSGGKAGTHVMSVDSEEVAVLTGEVREIKKCSHCGRPGHLAKDCFFIKKKKKAGDLFYRYSQEELDEAFAKNGKGRRGQPRDGAANGAAPNAVKSSLCLGLRAGGVVARRRTRKRFTRAASRKARRLTNSLAAKQAASAAQEEEASDGYSSDAFLSARDSDSDSDSDCDSGGSSDSDFYSACDEMEADDPAKAVSVAAVQVERKPARSELAVGFAAVVLDGVLAVGALLDPGSITHNFVHPRIAAQLTARGIKSYPVQFRIRGATGSGRSSAALDVRVKRTMGGVVSESSESFLVLDTLPYDVLLGKPSLISWGWLREWEGVGRVLDEVLVAAAQALPFKAGRARRGGAGRARASCSYVASVAAGEELDGLDALATKVLEADVSWRQRSDGSKQAAARASLQYQAAAPSIASRAANARWEHGYGMAMPSCEPPPRDAPVAWEQRDVALEKRQRKRARARGQCWAQYVAGTRNLGVTGDGRAMTDLLPSPVGRRGKELRVRFTLPISSDQKKSRARGTRFWVEGVGKVRATTWRQAPWGGKVFSGADHARRWGRRVVSLLVVEADVEGDAGAAEFRGQLAELKRSFGFFDETRIFDPDISIPSKMGAMKLPLVAGADPHSLKPYHKRFTPPMKEEMRTQVTKMVNYKVCERAGPGAVVSNVHLARKPEKLEDRPGGGGVGQAAAVPDADPRRNRVPGVAPLPSLPSAGRHQSTDRTASKNLSNFQSPQTFTGQSSGGVPQVPPPPERGVVVPRKPRWRFCIDYRRINRICIQEHYPLPETRECIEYLSGGELFGSVDLSAMYWQIELSECSRYLTGFQTEDGVWQMRRVPFGLKSAVAHAQREFRKCLRSDPALSRIWNYIDDCFWCSRGENKYADFLAQTRALFEMCERMNIKLSAEKTILGASSIRCLGHIVDSSGVRIDPARTAAITAMPEPVSCKTLEAALGSMGYVRSFVDGFSVIAAPLTGMKQWSWGAKERDAFAQLRAAIAAAGVLSSPNYDKQFYVQADTSKVGTGGSLWQWGEAPDGSPTKLVIAYCSKKFNKREAAWKTIEQETFGLVFALQKFRQFVQGCSVVLLTDHRNIVWLNANETSSKIIRWAMVLDEYIYSIEHVPGKSKDGALDMRVEDGISRAFAAADAPDDCEGKDVAAMSLRERGLMEREGIQLSVVAPAQLQCDAWSEDEEGEGDCDFKTALRGFIACAAQAEAIKGAPAPRPAAALNARCGDDEVRVGKGSPLEEHMRVLALVIAAARICSPVTCCPVGHANPRRPRRPARLAAQVLREERARAGDDAQEALQEAEARAEAAAADPDAAPAELESELHKASKALLRTAQRLAAAARPIAHTNVRWRQTRETAAPSSYGGQRGLARRMQADAAAAARGAAPIDDPRLIIWSELAAADKQAHMQRMHAFPFGHAGIAPTVQRLARSGKFSLRRGELERMRVDVAAFKAACPTCQLLQNARRQERSVSIVPARPFIDLSVDILSLSPVDDDGNDCVIVIVDNFTGWTELSPSKSKTAEAVVRRLVDYFGRYGAPVVVRTDQGPAFDSELMDAFNKAANITPNRAIPHHHQAAGVVERLNQEVLQLVSAMVLDDRVVVDALLGWADVLPFVQRIVNSSVTRKTGFSPSQLLFGDAVDLDRLIFDYEGGVEQLQREAVARPFIRHGDYVQSLVDVQEACVRAALDLQSERIAKAMAGRLITPHLTVVPGEWVLARFPEDQQRDKLLGRWVPHKVLGMDSESAITVHDAVRDSVRSVHADDLVKFDWSWLPLDTPEEVKEQHALRLAKRVGGALRQPLLKNIVSMRVGPRGDPVGEDFRRTVRGVKKPWNQFQFLVEWSVPGAENSWVPFSRVERTDQLNEFRAAHPHLC